MFLNIEIMIVYYLKTNSAYLVSIPYDLKFRHKKTCIRRISDLDIDALL